jgi:hypothetical protein
MRSGVRSTWTGFEKLDKCERGPGVRKHSVWCQGTQCLVSGNTMSGFREDRSHGVTEHSNREREWQDTVLGNESGRTQC